MKYEVFCDESQPDVFWSKSDRKAEYLVIGGLWLPAELRQEIKGSIGKLKEEYEFPHEIKWRKAHKDNEAFYKALIDLFIDYGDQLRFRCIVIEAEKVNMVKFHQDDKELGFYKFYYQLIKHWISDFNEYRIFCDYKTNRVPNRLEALKRTLDCANKTSQIINVQALPSKEVVLLQLADLFVGIASSRFNGTIKQDSAKERIIGYLESSLRETKLKATRKSESKYNIFMINLEEGW